MKFIPLSNQAKIPTRTSHFFNVFSPTQLKINPFERRELNFNLAVDSLDGECYCFVGNEKLFEFGIMASNQLITHDNQEIKTSLFNMNFPTQLISPDVFSGIFGPKNKYVVQVGDLIGRIFKVGKL